MKKKRSLLIACSVIMLCVCVIVGMSYALFTDSVTVNNHLQAGNLKVVLKRTNLEYSVLDEYGELPISRDTTVVDFTTSTFADKNVFGLDSSDILIVPGSYFDAKMKIENAGTTAFNYTVNIKLTDPATEETVNALAKQLRVTFTDHNGNTQSKMLSELLAGEQFDGAKLKKGESETFRVRIDFVDDREYNVGLAQNDRIVNNAAMSQLVKFDLIVNATQATDTRN